MQKMEPFADLMAQSPFVQKVQTAALAEGEARGSLKMRKTDILSIVKMRFPRLIKMARQKVNEITDLKTLEELFNKLVMAADAQAARLILEDLIN